MKYSLLLFFFIFNAAYSKFDFNYAGIMRSYPGLGAAFESEVGYSMPLWGRSQGAFSGLIRASLKGTSSIVVSDLDAGLSFYPVSFLALGTGKQMMKSDFKNFAFYDCENVRCQGNMNKVYSMGKIGFAHKAFLTSFTYKYFKNEYDDDDNTNFAVGEYQFALRVNPINEVQVQKSYFLGINTKVGTFGVVSNNVEFLRSDKYYFLNIGVYQFKASVFRVVLGAGALGNSDLSTSEVFVMRISHQVADSLALF